MARRVGLIIALTMLVGCSSRTLRIDDVDRSLIELQRTAVHSLPLGLRHTSDNSREYFSKYFVVSTKGREFKPAESSPERRYAHILILGDRRPYTIQVLVHVERRDSDRAGGYSEIGTDLGIAKVIQRRINQQLHERREDLNIIDDFRVF